MIMSGPGGGVDWGLKIIDAMNAVSSPVYTLCTGIAASMDAVIFAAGEKGHRYILPHSRVMIYEAAGTEAALCENDVLLRHTRQKGRIC